jgi:hypothetical protein
MNGVIQNSNQNQLQTKTNTANVAEGGGIRAIPLNRIKKLHHFLSAQ